MQKSLLLLILLLGSGAIAVSQDLPEDDNGVALLNQCEPLLDPGKLSEARVRDEAKYCLGYLEGINALYAIHKRMGLKTLYCVPQQGVSLGDAVRIVVQHLQANRDQLQKHSQAFWAVTALMRAFPCEPEQ